MTSINEPKQLWLSYAWLDNDGQDVDFAAQELERAGLIVHLDRWTLIPGKRHWEDIASFITDPMRSDAWALYATQNSLASEPCREEMTYALGRALESRGGTFPIIGIFPGGLATDLIPPAIKSRLYVLTTEQAWAERVAAAARGKPFKQASDLIEPYELREHGSESSGSYYIETRPRSGLWSFPFIGVPQDEVPDLLPGSSPKPRIYLNPKYLPPGPGGSVTQRWEGQRDGWSIYGCKGDATPTTSCFLWLKRRPSRITFGDENGRKWVMQ